jgi:mono/diheme cytochrome c family protein
MMRSLLLVAALSLAACAQEKSDINPKRATEVDRYDRAPEQLIPHDLDSRSDAKLLAGNGRFDTDEDTQPDSLPKLPPELTIDMIREGDRLFHGKGGCVNCHGSEATGLAGRGSSLTVDLHLLPKDDWKGIDSLIVIGVKDPETRSPIVMPPRGQHEDLLPDETRELAAYVWAIAHARGEPWPGGHAQHAPHDPNASARTLIP